ncbi:hypothetical protein B0H14DRAFT_2573668 [Mycena olivaceomarginata]|nr:hypothetical protein B0H14DRAFT_2573668 [Mycena olivaceomarginata]
MAPAWFSSIHLVLGVLWVWKQQLNKKILQPLPIAFNQPLQTSPNILLSALSSRIMPDAFTTLLIGFRNLAGGGAALGDGTWDRTAPATRVDSTLTRMGLTCGDPLHVKPILTSRFRFCVRLSLLRDASLLFPSDRIWCLVSSRKKKTDEAIHRWQDPAQPARHDRQPALPWRINLAGYLDCEDRRLDREWCDLPPGPSQARPSPGAGFGLGREESQGKARSSQAQALAFRPSQALGTFIMLPSGYLLDCFQC